MKLIYFKRYRMQVDLASQPWNAPLPPGYRFVPWRADLLETFAATKCACFQEELDANVFPCLGELIGCRRLMTEIAQKPGFLPEATWLVGWELGNGREPDYCGTIQGIRDKSGMGAIQNLGIIPAHRGIGLGTSLLFRCLRGFREAGLRHVYLEVTAQNTGAVRLYRRLGFQTVKTLYKAVEMAYT